MARTYKRDGNGRFAGGGGSSSGGGGGKRPAAKSVSRGVNRLTRDNAGKITSVGGTGATARGGRLKTAAGNKRAMQTAKVSGGRPAGTMKGKVKRDPRAAGKVGQRKAAAKPASKSKTDLQVMQQADRMMGKLSKRQASIQVDKVGLNEGLRQVRRNNARAGRVNTALAKRGLLEKYTKLTAPADAIRMTPAGKGIPKPAATPKPAAAPKATAKRKTGQEIMKAEVRKVQNKKLRDINAEIKAAGPNAINLRVEKLALQNNMLATQSRQTAKQVAKSEKQTQVVRGRIAEMRRDRERIGRAAANRTRNADARNLAAPMSKASFAPRPSKKTIRSQNQADKALDFYANPTKALRTVSKRKPGFRLPRNMR
jgi:hypothetical protein